MKATRAILKAVAAAEAEGRVTPAKTPTFRDYLAADRPKVVALPWPPSTNHLFISRGNRRFKSQAYRDWLDAARPLAERLMPPYSYPCAVSVVICGEVNESRDGDNFLKPILDCLVSARVLKGDSLRHINELHLRYRPADGNGEAVVLVTIGEG